jgi:hypothetical protein
MSYSSLREVDQSYHCFMEGPPSPPPPPEPSCRGPVSLPRTNQIYAVNADPSNPLRCTPLKKISIPTPTPPNPMK